MSTNSKLQNSEKILQLSSLVSVRNHLAFLLNNGSRSLVSKDDARKISLLIAEMDKQFLTSLLSDTSLPSPTPENKGFIKYGDSAVVENGAVLISHPANESQVEDKQLSFDLSKEPAKEKVSDEKTDEEKSIEKPAEQKQLKKVKKPFKRSDD